MKSSAKATNRKTVDMDSAMLGYAAMLYSSVNLLTRGALHCPSGAASLHEYRGRLSSTTLEVQAIGASLGLYTYGYIKKHY